MRPSTAFAIAVGIVALLVLGGAGAVALVLVSQPPKATPAAQGKPAEARAAPVPPVAEPALSGRVSGRTYKGGDSRFYARLFMDADLEHQIEGEQGLLIIADDLAIKTFAEAVLDDDVYRAQVACQGLVRIGPASKVAIPLVRRAAQQHPSETVRKAAAMTVDLLQKL